MWVPLLEVGAIEGDCAGNDELAVLCWHIGIDAVQGAMWGATYESIDGDSN